MNDSAPPENMLTRRAIAAIGADDPNSDWILRPEEHAAKLPPEAGALKRILTLQEQKDAQEFFRIHDTLANIAQNRYKRAGRRGLVATLVATLIGASFLLPPLQNLPAHLRSAGTALEYLLLFVAFVVATYLAARRPFPEWMRERAHAEIARIKLFNGVVDSQQPSADGELPSLPLKLEYFRRYQLDVQRRYYRGRGRQHERAAGHTKRWQSLSLGLSLTTALIACWASAPILTRILAYYHISLPPLLQRPLEFAASLPLDSDRWLMALGVAASALYAFATSRSLMNLDERNASRYLTTCDNLDFLAGSALRSARDKAAQGNEAEVRAFVSRAQALISSEHQEWISLRDAVGPGI